jgi:hypothetical protein
MMSGLTARPRARPELGGEQVAGVGQVYLLQQPLADLVDLRPALLALVVEEEAHVLPDSE